MKFMRKMFPGRGLGMARWAFLLLLAGFVHLAGVETASAAKPEVSLKPSEVGRRIEFVGVKCGQNGVRQAKAIIQIIVVGSSGNLNCIIRITEKSIRASDFHAGYACVSAGQAKPAFIVSKDDWRVTFERGYKKQLAIAEAYSAKYHMPIEVVYILTSAGPPHAEKRCRKMLSSS